MLQEYREQIDVIDKQLVELIFQREKTVLQLGIYKKEQGLPVLDTKREAEIIAKLAQATELRNHDGTLLLNIYAELFKHSRELQYELRK